jgi:hypothetical protein
MCKSATLIIPHLLRSTFYNPYIAKLSEIEEKCASFIRCDRDYAIVRRSHLASRKIDGILSLSTKPKALILPGKANKKHVTLLRCF